MSPSNADTRGTVLPLGFAVCFHVANVTVPKMQGTLVRLGSGGPLAGWGGCFQASGARGPRGCSGAPRCRCWRPALGPSAPPSCPQTPDAWSLWGRAGTLCPAQCGLGLHSPSKRARGLTPWVLPSHNDSGFARTGRAPSPRQAWCQLCLRYVLVEKWARGGQESCPRPQSWHCGAMKPRQWWVRTHRGRTPACTVLDGAGIGSCT